VTELKRQPGDGPLLLGCGPGLFATFVGLDLIDEYRFTFNPVLASRGKGLFDRLGQRVALTLRETRILDASSVLLIYEPARRGDRIDEPSAGRVERTAAD
jgi:riboflavin biosynthesis pyrimidine reductase